MAATITHVGVCELESRKLDFEALPATTATPPQKGYARGTQTEKSINYMTGPQRRGRYLGSRETRTVSETERVKRHQRRT